jgi:hypothetical protein
MLRENKNRNMSNSCQTNNKQLNMLWGLGKERRGCWELKKKLKFVVKKYHLNVKQ